MGWKEEFHKLMFDENNLNEAISLYEEKRPKTIFRFRKGTIEDVKTLEDNNIWLSRLNAVNDMFEGTFEVTHNNHKFVFEELEEVLQKYAIDMLDEVIPKFYVACFCEDYTSVPMWSYYSDYHKGFCIEYAIEDFEQCIFPVIYLDNKKIDIDDITIPRMQKNLSEKDMHWSVENEWRLLEPRPIDSGKGLKMSQPTPKGIYLGVSSNENPLLEKKLRSYCLKYTVPLFKMKVDRIRRKLYRDQIM